MTGPAGVRDPLTRTLNGAAALCVALVLLAMLLLAVQLCVGVKPFPVDLGVYQGPAAMPAGGLALLAYLFLDRAVAQRTGRS